MIIAQSFYVSTVVVAHQLRRVDDILPGDVCRRSDGRQGVHVGQGKPYGKDGVFLRQTLAAGYGVAETAAYHAAYLKLYQAHDQCAECQCGHVEVGVGRPVFNGKVDAAADDDKQRHGPQVKR